MQKGMGPSNREHSQHVAPTARRIPLWLKLAYTAFMAVLVPIYLHNYGPTNFLYFCDVALIITLVGIWIESPFLVSMCAVGIIASQTLWVIDFLSNLIGRTTCSWSTIRCSCVACRCFTAGCPFCWSIWCGGSAMTGARCRLGPWLPGRWCSSRSSSCRRHGPIQA